MTKNFLAKTATAAPILRGGDKGILIIGIYVSYVPTANRSIAAPNGQSLSNVGSTTKPRLIAKSTSSNAMPRPGASNTNGDRPGPDASKVWNKNRRTISINLQ